VFDNVRKIRVHNNFTKHVVLNRPIRSSPIASAGAGSYHCKTDFSSAERLAPLKNKSFL